MIADKYTIGEQVGEQVGGDRETDFECFFSAFFLHRVSPVELRPMKTNLDPDFYLPPILPPNVDRFIHKWVLHLQPGFDITPNIHVQTFSNGSAATVGPEGRTPLLQLASLLKQAFTTYITDRRIIACGSLSLGGDSNS